MCVDTTLSPKDPTQNYPLMTPSLTGTGCGTLLGTDTSSDQID